MKRATIFLFALSALVTGVFARDDYSINKITAGFVQTPQINFSGNVKAAPPQQMWLEVEVEFKSLVEFTDSLEFKYFVFLDNKCTAGSVTHVNIPKGNLLSVMYESPMAIARLAKGRSSKSVTEVTVQVLDKGQVVAEKSLKNTPTGWWTKLDQNPGCLLNKNQTPFAPLYWDRYMEIKSAAQ